MFISDANCLGIECKSLFCFELWGSEMRFMYYCVSNKEKWMEAEIDYEDTEKTLGLLYLFKSLLALHFRRPVVHYEVWDGHDWLSLSSSILEGLLLENVSSSPTINLISLNKSIHYPGSTIDRQEQSVYLWIIKHKKTLIGLLIKTTSKSATLCTM